MPSPMSQISLVRLLQVGERSREMLRTLVPFLASLAPPVLPLQTSTQGSNTYNSNHGNTTLLCMLIVLSQGASQACSDAASEIAIALKRTPGAGREKIIDPNNLSAPACAPEAYGGELGNGADSNPITGQSVIISVKTLPFIQAGCCHSSKQ